MLIANLKAGDRLVDVVHRVHDGVRISTCDVVCEVGMLRHRDGCPHVLGLWDQILRDNDFLCRNSFEAGLTERSLVSEGPSDLCLGCIYLAWLLIRWSLDFQHFTADLNLCTNGWRNSCGPGTTYPCDVARVS